MSTRSCIGRKDGSGFKGVYHHSDGYPSGVGAEIHHLVSQHGIEAVRKRLLLEHPAGFSCIIGADWNLPCGWQDYERRCTCGRNYVEHLEWPAGKGPGQMVAAIGGNALGHAFEEAPPSASGMTCYCHGGRSEEANEITDRTAAGCGCEYVYLLEDDGLHILTSIGRTGRKMVGMFGMGDERSTWRLVTVIPWSVRAASINWNRLDRLAASSLTAA